MQKITLGDTNVEAVIFEGLLKRLPQDRFHGLIDQTCSTEYAQKRYHNCGFSSGPQSAEDFRKAFGLLVGNTLVNYSHVGIANASKNSDAWRDKVYLYHYEGQSPFPGPTQAISYHGLCAMLKHLNELPSCPAPTPQVSLEAARIWTPFAHEEQPWGPYSQNGRFMRFGPEGRSGAYDFESDTTREYKFQTRLGERIDKVGKFVRMPMLNLENDEI